MRSSLVRIAAMVAALALFSGSAMAAGPSASKASGITGVVNVNAATPDELALLPGVGPSRAQAIVEHRKSHGAFKSVDELGAVKGIGAKALERMRPHVAFDGKTTAERSD